MAELIPPLTPGEAHILSEYHRHASQTGLCALCCNAWPCATARLLADRARAEEKLGRVEKLRSAYETLSHNGDVELSQGARDMVRAVARQLREALADPSRVEEARE